MDIFSQNKTLIKIVVLLICLNLLLAGLLIFKSNLFHPYGSPPGMPPNHEEKEELARILKDELELNDQQVEAFRNLRGEFFVKERNLQHLLRSQRDSMNTEMFQLQTDTLLVMAISKRISANEYNMEMLRLQQALALKKICTPKQLKRFEELVIEIRDYFKPGGPPHLRH